MDTVAAIFFDLDDTLCDEAGSVATALEATSKLAAERLGLPQWESIARTYGIVGDLLWADFDSWGRGLGKTAVRRYVWKVTLRTGGYRCDDALVAEIGDHYTAMRSSNHQWIAGAREALQSLRDKYRLGIITNGSAQIQREKINALGLVDICHGITVAEECGWSKPNPAIFQQAMKVVRAKPAECLMVGDRPDMDILGAQRLGMRGVWIAPDHRHWPLTEDEPWQKIASVAELPSLLG